VSEYEGAAESVLTVETSTGPVDLERLGRTLMHEHVFTFHSDMHGDYPWHDEQRYVEGAVEKLKKLKEVGFDSLVDLTVFGIGRNVARVAKVARTAEFNVVVASGVYTYRDLPIYFRFQTELSDRRYIEDLFVREVEEGIGDTGIRAAVLKCVTDVPGLTPDVEFLLRTVARAHLRTGVPISTHTDPHTETGLLQQRIFRQEGVDLSNVIIGHCGDTTDLAYLERLLQAGSYIGMDRFGNYLRTSFKDRIETVVALCNRGYASRMVLSHDANCGGDIRSQEALENWRYGAIPTEVLPALRSRGVTEEQIDLMARGNPKAIFARAATLRGQAARTTAGDR
jgi:phosphotriesterase-related protein